MHIKYKLILPLVFLLSGIMLYPFIFSLWLSLQDYRLTRINDVQFVGFENFGFIATDQSFLNAMGNTISFVASAVIIELILGLSLALLIQKLLIFRGFVRSILLAPMFITPIAVGLMFRFFTKLRNRYNTFLPIKIWSFFRLVWSRISIIFDSSYRRMAVDTIHAFNVSCRFGGLTQNTI